ncbi:MAG TPA: PD-(D/E)XK nuclease family protein, partial [Solirubrobacteraceae bacterium]|nr:PD-(D/E)XK nuclease family protein [Solirubrobacteraceae bacterium]
VRVTLNAPATVGRVLREAGAPATVERVLREAPAPAPGGEAQLVLDLGAAATAAPAVGTQTPGAQAPVPTAAPAVGTQARGAPAPVPRGAPAPVGAPPAPGARPGAPPAVAPELAPPVVAPELAPPVVATVSYTALGAYAACGYRFYLQRLLRLPDAEVPPHLRGAGAGGEDARLRGSIVHRLLEHADLRPGAALPSADDVRAAAAAAGTALGDEQVDDVLRLLGAFAASGVRERLAAARAVWREHPFALGLGRDAGAPLLTGVVDVLAVEPDGTRLVVDYKTDRVGEEDLHALVARDYGLQRAAYALAALRDGAPAVEVVHLYLERPHEPVAARFAAPDALTLQAALREAASGALAGDYPVAAEPHAALCASCPGRGGLCSWPPEMTDRAATATAGAGR